MVVDAAGGLARPMTVAAPLIVIVLTTVFAVAQYRAHAQGVELAELRAVAASAERLRAARSAEAERAEAERAAADVARTEAAAAEARGARLAAAVREGEAAAERWRARAAHAEQRAAAAEGREVEICPRACYAIVEPPA